MAKRKAKTFVIISVVLILILIIGGVGLFFYLGSPRQSVLSINDVNQDLTSYCNHSNVAFTSTNTKFTSTISERHWVNNYGMVIMPTTDIYISQIKFYPPMGGDYVVIANALTPSGGLGGYTGEYTLGETISETVKIQGGGTDTGDAYANFNNVHLISGNKYIIVFWGSNGGIGGLGSPTMTSTYFTTPTSPVYPYLSQDIIWEFGFGTSYQVDYASVQGVKKISYTKGYSGCVFPDSLVCTLGSVKCHNSTSYSNCKTFNVTGNNYNLFDNPINCAPYLICDDSSGTATCINQLSNKVSLSCVNPNGCNYGLNRPGGLSQEIDGIRLINSGNPLINTRVTLTACRVGGNCISTSGATNGQGNLITDCSTAPCLRENAQDTGIYYVYANLPDYGYITNNVTFNIKHGLSLNLQCPATVQTNKPIKCTWTVTDNDASGSAVFFDASQLNPTVHVSDNGNDLNYNIGNNEVFFTPTQDGDMIVKVDVNANGYIGDSNTYKFVASSNFTNPIESNPTPIINDTPISTNTNTAWFSIDNSEFDPNNGGYSVGNHELEININNSDIQSIDIKITTPSYQVVPLTFTKTNDKWISNYQFLQSGQTYIMSGAVSYKDSSKPNTVLNYNIVIGGSSIIPTNWTFYIIIGSIFGISLIVIIIIVILVIKKRKKR